MKTLASFYLHPTVYLDFYRHFTLHQGVFSAFSTYSNLAVTAATRPYKCKNCLWKNSVCTEIKNSNGNIWHCPSDVRSGNNQTVWGNDNSILSYGINQAYRHNPDLRQKPYLLWNGINSKLIKNPVEFITFADCTYYWIGTSFGYPMAPVQERGETAVNGGCYGHVSLRHSAIGKKFNAAFFDGHAVTLQAYSMPTQYWDYNNDKHENFE